MTTIVVLFNLLPEADPDAYEEISRKTVLELTCWTKPTYAHGRILLRNDAGQIVCLVQN